MLVLFRGAVAVAIAQAHQLLGRCMRAGAILPGVVQAAVMEVRLHIGQWLAGQGAGIQPTLDLGGLGQATEHGGEGLAEGVQHQGNRPGLAGFVLDEVDR